MPTIEEVKTKLVPPDAPPAPAALLDAIKREIPEPLPEVPVLRRRLVPLLVWGSLAATILVGVLVVRTGGRGVRQAVASAPPRVFGVRPATPAGVRVSPTMAATPTVAPTLAPAELESLRALGYLTPEPDPGRSFDTERLYRDGQFLQAPEGIRSDPGSDALSSRPGPRLPPSDMKFRDHGVNPATRPAFDSRSTFALDVDTGSFTLVRRYLQDGNLPPAAAVRVEEVVNALDYGDPAPESEDFAVRLEGAPTPFVPGISYRLVRIGLRARQVESLERRPAVLTFLVDTSGSMEKENRLGLVKRALGMLLRELRPEDRLALVTFGTEGRILLSPTHDHDAIRRAVSGLQPSGNTNLEEGLALAYHIAGAAYRPGAINRIILLSDGVANVGLTEPESILAQVAESARRGIELTTIGVGMGNYNDALMERLADLGDGRYAYVDAVDEAHRLFVRELTSTLETMATDARVQVEWNPRVVASYRLLGYENRAMPDHQFRDDAADAGEIGSGHAVTALYEIKLAAEAPHEPLATVRLRYRKPQGGPIVELATDIEPSAVADSWHDASRSLRLAAVAAELAETLRHAPPGRGHDTRDLADAAGRLATDFPGDPSVHDLADLVARAQRLMRSPY